MVVTGIRKAEGGPRSFAYGSCFNEGTKGYSTYMPLFWYKKADKEEYEKEFDIVHSKCYTFYTFTRTGCALCPFSGTTKKVHLMLVERYEPNLYKAVNNIFKDTYEYTRQYKEYCKQKLKEKKQ